jgi:AraC-like DNA-binding protein
MGVVQSYRERLPTARLAEQVSAVWLMQVAAEGAAYEHRTVPNGSVELAYELGSDRVDVSGPQHLPTVARLAPGSTVVGIRFRPGVAPSILGPPASELVDLRVEVDRLWGRGAATLAERLAEAASTAAVARLLEDEVTARVAVASEPDALVATAVGGLQPWRQEDVGALAADLNISSRQLRRRFVAALGVGPKAFQRIVRFQGFLALTQGHRDDHVGLARLAQRAGYADQAHLTRECSALTGLTPRAFLEEMWTSCGPNHDHEVSYARLRRALLTPPSGARVAMVA